MNIFGFLILLTILILSSGVNADETLDLKRGWESAVLGANLSKENGDCSKLWSTFDDIALWDTPYKYKARRKLYNYILPTTPSEPALIPPVMNGEHDITRLRHALFIAVHSKPGLIKNVRYPALDLIERFLPDTDAKDKFIICVQNEPNKDCAEILVNAKEVPSYDDYHTENQVVSPRVLTSRCGKQIEINFSKRKNKS